MNPKILESHKNWPLVKEIIQKISHHGFKIFLVGGSVRDFLMNKVPQDFDLVTNAKFSHLKKFFPQAIKVGQSFGVLKISHKKSLIELSSFRKDGPYKDGRHPSFVKHASHKEDALRRDFTVNSMFYDFEKDCVIDFFSGMNDLKSKIIRSTGLPNKKFKEDYLRMLRAFRFVSKLDFDIEQKTFLAIFKLSSKIDLISKERIKSELTKIFLNPFRLKAINYLSLTPILKILFPFYDIKDLNQDKKALSLWCQTKYFLSSSQFLSLPYLFSGFFINQIKYWEYKKKHTWLQGIRNILEGLKELNFSKKTLSDTEYILKNHWIYNRSFFLRLLSLNGENKKYFLSLLDHELNFVTEEKFLKTLKKERDLVLKRYKELTKKAKKLPPPWINGYDLLKIGIPSGKNFSYLLESLYKYQLIGKFKTKEEALNWVLSKNLISKKPEIKNK